jgi:hypothetical protein
LRRASHFLAPSGGKFGRNLTTHMCTPLALALHSVSRIHVRMQITSGLFKNKSASARTRHTCMAINFWRWQLNIAERAAKCVSGALHQMKVVWIKRFMTFKHTAVSTLSNECDIMYVWNIMYHILCMVLTVNQHNIIATSKIF